MWAFLLIKVHYGIEAGWQRCDEGFGSARLYFLANEYSLTLLPIIAKPLLRAIILRTQLLTNALLALNNAPLVFIPKDPKLAQKRKRATAALGQGHKRGRVADVGSEFLLVHTRRRRACNLDSIKELRIHNQHVTQSYHQTKVNQHTFLSCTSPYAKSQ